MLRIACRGRSGNADLLQDSYMPAPTDPIRFYDRALSRLTRRELLNIAWKLGPPQSCRQSLSDRVLAQPLFRSYPFPLGVASGDPWPDSVVLWTRLAPEPLEGGGMPMANVEVGWEIARDRAFRTIVTQGHGGGAAGARAQRARRGGRARAGPRILVSLPLRRRGQPDRAHQDGARRGRRRRSDCASPSAAAATTRPATSPRSGASRRGAISTSSSTPATTSTRAAPTPASNPAVVRQHRGDEIYTLVDYRNRYALYKSDPDLRAAHASAPFIVTWDDHEVDNDYAGDMRRGRHAAGGVPAAPRRRVSGVLRDHAAAGVDAADRTRRCGCTGGCDSARLIDFSVLDTRQYPIQPGVQRRSRDRLRRRCATRPAPSSAPSRSSGCSNSLARPRATWTVLGQQVPTFARDMVARRAERAVLDGQVGRLRRVASAAATRGCARRRAAQPDRAVRRRARRTTAPTSRLDFADPRVGDRRRRVHEHLDHVGWRRQRSGGRPGSRFGRTTRTSSITAPAAATSPAPRHRRRCAPTSRCSIGSRFPMRRSEPAGRWSSRRDVPARRRRDRERLIQIGCDCRNAVIGSCRLARRAGSHAAAPATTSSNTTAAPNESGSMLSTPNSRRSVNRDRATAAPSPTPAPIITGRSPARERQALQLARRAAQGEAHTELTRAAHHGEAHSGIDANRRERQRDEREQAGQAAPSGAAARRRPPPPLPWSSPSPPGGHDRDPRSPPARCPPPPPDQTSCAARTSWLARPNSVARCASAT